MSALLTRLAAVVAPPFCWGCGADAGRTEPLCGPCRAGLRWLGQEVVRLEGVPLWSAVAYEGPARSLVRALKYRGAPGLADPLAAAIAACAPPGLLAPGTVLVPVPMPAARRRRRGFDQAERIAAALAARTGLELRSAWPAARRRGRWAGAASSACSRPPARADGRPAAAAGGAPGRRRGHHRRHARRVRRRAPRRRSRAGRRRHLRADARSMNALGSGRPDH